MQQEEKKKPMFDTQTSTLFRALDDIAKQDLEKKLSEECQATTSFMSVDALLS